jgi:hypothetical protein
LLIALSALHWAAAITFQPLSKGQLISKANSKLFFEPKNQQKHFLIAALVSKCGGIKKI